MATFSVASVVQYDKNTPTNMLVSFFAKLNFLIEIEVFGFMHNTHVMCLLFIVLSVQAVISPQLEKYQFFPLDQTSNNLP